MLTESPARAWEASDANHALAAAARAAARLDLGRLDLTLTTRAGGIEAALALATRHQGEPKIVIGFAGVCHVRDVALARVFVEAAQLLAPWGPLGRLELQALRPRVRRAALLLLAATDALTVLQQGRRFLVAGVRPPARDGAAGPPANRRRAIEPLARGTELSEGRRARDRYFGIGSNR